MKKTTAALLIALAVLSLACAVGWIVAIQRGQTIRIYETAEAAAKAADKAKKDKADEIEKTPAADLVDKSPRADELTGARDKSAERAADRIIDEIRLRSREVISGGNGGSVR